MAKIESLLITVVVSSLPHEWKRRALEVGCIRKVKSWAFGDPGEDDIADVESVVQAKIVEAEDGVVVLVLVLRRKFAAERILIVGDVTGQRIEASKDAAALWAETFSGYVSGDVFDDILSQLSHIFATRDRAGVDAIRFIRLLENSEKGQIQV